MIPVAATTRRIRSLFASAIKRLPAASTAIPVGVESRALVAGPPSPLKPAMPVPAPVVMIPVPGATLRMRLLFPASVGLAPPAALARALVLLRLGPVVQRPAD